jgi:hypothetical protein
MHSNRWAMMFLVVAAAVLAGGTCGRQDPSPGPGPVIGSAIHHDVSAPLRDIRLDSARSSGSTEETSIEIPLRIPSRAPTGGSAESRAAGAPVAPTTLTGSTAAEGGGPAPVPSVTPPAHLNFEGLSDADNQAVVGFRLVPPDTEGDIGPNHYVQWINIIFQIWDIARNGDGDPISATPVFPQPLPGNAIWTGFGGFCEVNNDGDPIVVYDHLADRWLLSQFSVDEGIQCIALSQTPDPGGPYDRWAFLVSPGEANDYPKFGVMPDAYYLSLRDFPSSNGLASAVAFDRADMLGGGGAPTFIKFSLPCFANDCVDGFQPPHLEGPAPAPGSPGIFTKVWDDDFDGPLTGADGIRLWEFRPNFANPPASSFVELAIVPSSADFDNDMCGYFNRDCIPQQSSSQRLDPIDELQMYRAQFRHFPSHDTLLVNSTVDATGTDVAGIYWAELRNSGGGWMRFQDGTYAPADGENRWMGSIAMDAEGNIALGYSVSSFSTDPSIRYVTRESGDALGTLPGGEVEMIAGGGAQVGSTRWGDYSTMSVDPVADCTFWYTQEYYANTGAFDFKTRIAAFKMPSCNGVEPPDDDLTFYSDRGTFDDLFPDLPCEDFEEGNVASGGLVGCPAPLDENSNDACFSPGDIEPGIAFVDDPGPDEIDGLVLNWANGAPTKNVVANTFSDAYVIDFTGGDTLSAGMDLVAYFANDTCEIDIFGTSGLLGSTTAPCTNAGSFWGVSSESEVITQIVVRAPTNQAEGVDDICFGTARVAAGEAIVSFSVEAGLLNATLGGELVRPVDAVDLRTGDLVFSAFPDTILEDIDAFHLLPGDEGVVFSTSTDVTQGFGGIANIKNGDLVHWDGVSATLLFSELIGFGGANNNIDGFSILPNGNWLLSTDLDAILGGLSFQNGDIVEYDPVADVATLYEGLDEATIFTGAPNSNPDIDALHARPDGTVIFSIRSEGIGRVGNPGPSYGFADAPRTDLFEIDPATREGALFLDGAGIFDGLARNLDAVALPPGQPTQIIESFDDGNLDEYVFVSGPPSDITISAQAAHDGPFGAQADGSAWMYRNDADVLVGRGDVVSAWVQANGAAAGRAYFGFGASAAGTLSLVMAPNTNEFLIQRNSGFGFQDIGSSSQSWNSFRWYRMEANWHEDGTIVGNLYDSDGTTLINSVIAAEFSVFSGGIAFRGFSLFKFFDTVERRPLQSSVPSTIELPPPPPPCVDCPENFPPE